MKSNSFLLILSGISIIFIIASIIFVLYNNNKCGEIQSEESEVFAKKYFDLLETSAADEYANMGRGAYLFSEWINEYENKITNASSYSVLRKKYNNFLDKLLTTFENESSFLEVDTKYSMIDNNNKKVYFTLKKDGKFDAVVNECEGYSRMEGNYKIINNEIVLIESDYASSYGWDIFFLYKYQNILQSITWSDCGSLIAGTNLFKE